MKKWSIFLTVLALSLTLSSWLPRAAWAGQVRSAPNQITVQGIVPERRGIIVDTAGKILQITSNTPNDVTPVVHLLSDGGQAVPFTPDLQQKYAAILALTGDNKDFTITPAKTAMAELFPRFVPALPEQVYDVEPVKWGVFTDPKPYRIAL